MPGVLRRAIWTWLNLIPKSELVLVPKCGHMSTMERPDEVTAAMRDG